MLEVRLGEVDVFFCFVEEEDWGWIGDLSLCVFDV